MPFDVRRSIRRHLLLAVLAVGVLVFGLGRWAVTTELAGAVIAAGQLTVASEVKKVQHPTGGIVGELRVREGDRVKAGDILLRLDATKARANLVILEQSLDELAARQARDEAARDGTSHVAFPASLLVRARSDPKVSRLIAGEETLFQLQKSSRAGRKAQLIDHISQLNQQILGLSQQIASKTKEIVLLHQELIGIEELWRKNLIQSTRVVSLRRDVVRTEGELGQLVSSTAEARGKLDEVRLQMLQIDQDLGAEIGKDLAEVRGKTAETDERRVPALEELKRVDIRAPQSGYVHQLSVHTIGGVIPAAEAILLIVPDNDSLRVDVKIAPKDIDQLHMGQKAILKFTAFNQRTTPEVGGTVDLVSADASQDAKTGVSSFLVHIHLSPDQSARLGAIKLVPGMPVEAFIQTTPRTALSYLTRPLHDQIRKAFTDN